MKKVYIETYGCQMNVADSEVVASVMETAGYALTTDIKEADAILINTCSVRDNAEQRVLGRLTDIRSQKREKKLIVGVIGCMAERNKEDLFKAGADLVAGPASYLDMPNLIAQAEMGSKAINVELSTSETYAKIIPTRIGMGAISGFVSIMRGCNNFCTYCIVPYTRGRERSRRFQDVLDECRSLINAGYQEITLLGQNVNAYGKDLDENKDFADLLEAVAKLGIPRLRFTTSHPWDFSSKMIDVIAKYDNIMKFIHLPVQSGNDEVLKLMGRRYNREQYLSLVKEMREKIPGLSLSTDIIVGFPNESEEQFQDTVSLVDEVKYEAAFTFIYSPRKGTPAARIEDNVTYETKSKRFQELVKHLEKHIEEHSRQMVGQTYPVLVDGVSKTDAGMLSGYTEENKLVHFKGDETLIGKIIKVKILESHTYSLIGEIIDE